MKIDLDHIHHWMQAIRQSKDPVRTLDAFWKGQINSKVWLIDNLVKFVKEPVNIDIHGGWVGVLASLMFQSSMPIRSIRSVDIDESCKETATLMNSLEHISGKFNAITADMCSVEINADVVINTSCEHISQSQYETWLAHVPNHSLIIVQSNNYKIKEHIRTAESIDMFIQQSKLIVEWADKLELPLYTRFMIVGYKS